MRATRTWIVTDIVTGSFNVPCDMCKALCRKHYEVLKNVETSKILNVGRACAFKLTGLKDRVIEAPDINEIGDMPDWML